MNTIAIAHSVKIAYPVYLAWLRNDFWGAKQIVVKTPAYPSSKGDATMKTRAIAIKHNRINRTGRVLAAYASFASAGASMARWHKAQTSWPIEYGRVDNAQCSYQFAPAWLAIVNLSRS
jgi:hypothetical protein